MFAPLCFGWSLRLASAAAIVAVAGLGGSAAVETRGAENDAPALAPRAAYEEARKLNGVWVRTTRTFGEDVKIVVWNDGPVSFVTVNYHLPFVGRSGTPTAFLGIKTDGDRRVLALPLPKKPRERAAGAEVGRLVEVQFRMEEESLELKGDYDLGFRKLALNGAWRRAPEGDVEIGRPREPWLLTWDSARLGFEGVAAVVPGAASLGRVVSPAVTSTRP